MFDIDSLEVVLSATEFESSDVISVDDEGLLSVAVAEVTKEESFEDNSDELVDGSTVDVSFDVSLSAVVCIVEEVVSCDEFILYCLLEYKVFENITFLIINNNIIDRKAQTTFNKRFNFCFIITSRNKKVRSRSHAPKSA